MCMEEVERDKAYVFCRVKFQVWSSKNQLNKIISLIRVKESQQSFMLWSHTIKRFTFMPKGERK